MSDPGVSIVVLNYNGRDLLPRCLESVEAEIAGDRASEVILVDNGSSDGSVAYVRGRHPWVRVIAAGENLGFAEGNNRGVEAAANDLVILLNNDAVVEPGWRKALVEYMEGHPEVAVASAQVITDGVPSRFYEMNGSITLSGHNVMRTFEDLETLFYANGCSLIFRKGILGLPFDPEYFCYAEDTYLSLRARFMGHGVAQAAGARVRHLGGVTSRRAGSARMVFYQERNRLLNIILFFSFGHRLKVVPYIAATSLGRLFSYIPTSPARAWHLARGHLWLLTHGGRIGRMRAGLRAEKRVDEREVIRWMSGRVASGEGAACRLANALSLAYCALMRIPVYERSGRGGA